MFCSIGVYVCIYASPTALLFFFKIALDIWGPSIPISYPISMPIKVLFVSLKSSVRLEEQHQPSPKLRMVTIHSILMAITIPMVITVIPKASCCTLNS